MLKVAHTFLALLLVSTLSFAQWGPPGGGGRNQPNRPQSTMPNLDTAPKGNSKITGHIVDEQLTTAVEFASVALLEAKTGKAIDGTMADLDGKFAINRVAEGTYSLVISFVGYETLKLTDIKIEKNKDLDLGVIKLKSSSIALEGVVVTGERPMIEEKVDRLVYNADKDLTAAGGDATDILKNVPMLSVDLDGNVSLRGSENIQVLINNKPSTIVASSIADALKMIPSDLIKTVEVITSPSARYDAEGTAGIINIITKKSSLQGLNLNFNSGIGNRASNIGFNGNYRVGKFGLSFGGFGRMMYNNKSKSEGFNENLVSGLITNQLSTGKSGGNFGRYNLGFDYDLGSGQTIFGNVALGKRGFTRSNEQDFNYYNRDNGVQSLIRNELRDMDGLNDGLTLDYSLDYLKIFEDGKEWSASAMYSNTNSKNESYINFLDGVNSIISQKQFNDNNSQNSELAFQTDYMSPIGKNQQLEVGLKSTMRKMGSDYVYYISDPFNVSQDRDDFNISRLLLDPSNPGGGLNYDQNIFAGYAAYTYSLANKLTIKAGGRFEYTGLSANQTINQLGTDKPVEQFFKDEYPVFVPSLNISRPFGDYTAKGSYNYRISRPGMWHLNPNVNISDPLNVSMGNTFLVPEKTHNVELSLSKAFGKTYLTVSTFGRYSGNNITRVSMTADGAASRFPDVIELQNLDPSAIVTTFENIGEESSIGGNFFGNISVSKALSFTVNLDYYHININGKEFKNNEMVDRKTKGNVLGGRASANLSLNDGWSVQADGGYRGKRVSLQGESKGMPRYSLAVRKDFSKAFSLGLGADNFFGRMTRENSSSTSQFISNNINYMYNQNVRLTLSYKLGNMRFVESRRNRGVTNDDQKAGGDDNMMENNKR